LRLQLWCWNYDPEPTAMGPIATAWATGMHDRGHDVEVVTAHCHYPPGMWPRRVLPRHEVRDGIRVTRLPLISGKRTGAARALEEVTYAASALAAATVTGRADAVVAVSPSFLGLAAVMAHSRLRRTPWVLWLQDILPDAAATTGLVRSGSLLRAARAFERRAYASATKIVVISQTFAENLAAKGVPRDKLVCIYNPATRGVVRARAAEGATQERHMLYVGNLGHSQGLAEFVSAFCAGEPGSLRLVVAGTGDQLEAVRSAASTPAVDVLGFVPEGRLEQELARASLALVSQRPDVREFNLPSRLMMLMGRGIPVLASVRPDSEVAQLVDSSGGGWVTDSADPRAAVELAHEIAAHPDELRRRGAAAAVFAREHFEPGVVLDRFEELLNHL
jgi:colanic acid biosynthesis glycosyl transferase WcaI